MQTQYGTGTGRGNGMLGEGVALNVLTTCRTGCQTQQGVSPKDPLSRLSNYVNTSRFSRRSSSSLDFSKDSRCSDWAERN